MLTNLILQLKEWENKIGLVLIKGTGDKAFCAGADLISMLRFENNRELALLIEKLVNTVVYLISSYETPYVALMDGVTMGTGVGLSIFGKYRIATERTVLGMPEIKVGLFPNVGATYFLPRLQNHLGFYMGLTGESLLGYDVYKYGIATHYCPSENLNNLEEALVNCSDKNKIDKILNIFNLDKPDYTSTVPLEKISRCFAGQTVEGIIQRLQKDDSIWAQETLNKLHSASPSTLKVTFEQLQRGQFMNLEDSLKLEYALSTAFIDDNIHKDFFHGIRARFVDKVKPKWNPSTISEISNDLVQTYFANA